MTYTNGLVSLVGCDEWYTVLLITMGITPGREGFEDYTTVNPGTR